MNLNKNKKTNHFHKHIFFFKNKFQSKTKWKTEKLRSCVFDLSSIDVVACSHVMKSPIKTD